MTNKIEIREIDTINLNLLSLKLVNLNRDIDELSEINRFLDDLMQKRNDYWNKKDILEKRIITKKNNLFDETGE